MENLNPKKNPITTIPGMLFLFLGLLMYALPMFIEVKKDFTETWYIPLLVILIGLGLIVAPDSLFTTILRGTNKAIDSKYPDKDQK